MQVGGRRRRVEGDWGHYPSWAGVGESSRRGQERMEWSVERRLRKQRVRSLPGLGLGAGTDLLELQAVPASLATVCREQEG